MAIKSILTASVLSVIGVAVSTAAFADVNTSTFCKPGFYAGIQGGRSDTFYHPDQALAQASNNGVGTFTTSTVNNGSSFTHVVQDVNTNTLSGSKTDDVGLGGSIYAGYQFNPYFALEAGYIQFAKTTSHAMGVNTDVNSDYTLHNGVILPGSDVNFVKTTNSKYYGEITENAIDLVAKGTLPLQYGFGLDAKLGVAYIHADDHINATQTGSVQTNFHRNGTVDNVVTTVGPNTTSTIYTKSYQKFAPIAAIGVNYTIPNTNMSVTADYTRIFSYGGIPNAKLASIGLEYKFA